MRRALAMIPYLLLAACDTAAGPSYAPPYLSLRGTITSSSVSTPSSVRVALVWRVPAGPGGSPMSAYKSVQELTVRAEFPVSFRLDVRDLPPLDAITAIGAAKTGPGRATGYAYGTLVVYEDTNGNGKLDLVGADERASDRVLGVPERLQIFYLHGGGFPATPDALPDTADILDFAPGFNLIRAPEYADAEPGCNSCAPQPVTPWSSIPIDAALEIALTAEPSLSRELCNQTGGSGGMGRSNCMPCRDESQCAECLGHLSPSPEIKCNADKTAFIAESCGTKSLCAVHMCERVSGRRDAGETAFASWPCR